MFRNYFITAWRNLLRNRGYSAINIVGLGTGMGVALLIGLWISDELSFDRYHRNYGRLAEVMDIQTINGEVNTNEAIAVPLADALRGQYKDAFKRVALVFPPFSHSVAVGDKTIAASGVWAEPELPEMLTLKMVSGSRDALRDPSSVLITRSLARTLFGGADPMNRSVRLDNMADIKVAGVYEDLPQNTTFYGTELILSWDKALTVLPWLKGFRADWGTRYWKLFVELNKGMELSTVNAMIRTVAQQHIRGDKEEILLHPMSQWHLYNEFKNGSAAGGRIWLVVFLGIIGGFVLLLACINFMNLSTARSAQRAKEVGIRKAIGSRRGQLVGQFLYESVLVAFLSLLVAMGLALLCLPFFNRLTQKQVSLPFASPLFWMLVTGFTILTGLIAGSYPAFYLSAFHPVKVLKGNPVVGRWASLPRKILIVVQFTASIMLVLGTLIIYRQIRYGRDRPVGYTRAGLITVAMNTQDIYDADYNVVRDALIRSGAVSDMAECSIHATEAPWKNRDLNWKGKDPNSRPLIGSVTVTHDFGHTIGWQIRQGRDFSRSFLTDSESLVINEASARLIGFRHPVGETINFEGKDRLITGVIGDMVMESPYMPVLPTIFQLEYHRGNAIIIRINPRMAIRDALAKIETVFRKYNPGAFVYQFTDEEYAMKFGNEELIAKLAIVFTVLAIFVSCLGLSGLASFTAEQRRKEIGVRKVLGAQVMNLWLLLLSDHLRLVVLSILIASPAAAWCGRAWLQQYPYRTGISWGLFVFTGGGALAIALLTVGYQSIRAASMNPTKSLRTI